MYGSCWSETLTAGGEDEMAIAFSFANFNSQSTTYPGYDMDIGFRMASIKVAFTNRIIQEIATYFGKFAKIQEIIALTAQNVHQVCFFF